MLVIGKVWVMGGRVAIDENDQTSNEETRYTVTAVNEAFDIETKTWTKHAPLPLPRADLALTSYARESLGRTTTIAVGGQSLLGFSYKVVEEYDPQQDVWYCWPPLAANFYAGGIGFAPDQRYAFEPFVGCPVSLHGHVLNHVYDIVGRLHVVAGGEAYGLAASRSVQVIDTSSIILPVPCAYEPVLINPWNETAKQSLPFPTLQARGGYALPALKYNAESLQYYGPTKLA